MKQYVLYGGYSLSDIKNLYYLYGEKEKVEEYIQNRLEYDDFGYGDDCIYNSEEELMEDVIYWKEVVAEWEKEGSKNNYHFIEVK